jgi:hypothetical protein
MSEQGVPVEEIAHLVGHSNTSTTETARRGVPWLGMAQAGNPAPSRLRACSALASEDSSPVRRRRSGIRHGRTARPRKCEMG